MHHLKDNIAFIGARGAGKSKLSRKLGKLTGRVTLSTDTLISYEDGGRPIHQIVAAEGWRGFRQREYEILQKLSAMTGLLIDCGGGILVDVDDRGDEIFSERKAQLLRDTAAIVYIRRGANWLIDRGQADAVRPTLAADYETVLLRRLPWYESAADFTIDLQDRSIEEAIVIMQREFELKAQAG